MNPEEHLVLLTDVPLNDKANRKNMIEIMFENLNVPAVCIVNQSMLPLLASGKANGIFLDSGDGVTYVIPIHEQFILSKATIRLDMAGCDITEYLAKILSERNHRFSSTAKREIVREIKEKLSFVALDFGNEMKAALTGKKYKKLYELPSGSRINLAMSASLVLSLYFNRVSLDKLLVCRIK